LLDGRKISPQQVLGEFRPGVRLVVVGDTGNTENIIEIARDADGLVIEGTYLQEEAEMARQFSHLTVRQAAELARDANVRQLYITHVSRRYRDKDILNEALEVFPSSSLAHDMDTFQVKQQESKST